MERLLEFGYGLIDLAKNASVWLLSPISDVGIPLTWNEINYGSLSLPLDITVADFILGTGIVFVLGFKLVKFLLDVVF